VVTDPDGVLPRVKTLDNTDEHVSDLSRIF
jgi:hypothetical protein